MIRFDHLSQDFLGVCDAAQFLSWNAVGFSVQRQHVTCCLQTGRFFARSARSGAAFDALVE
jgi:hypothetical protein